MPAPAERSAPAALVLVLGLCACGRIGEERPETLDLILRLPSTREGVLLNEPLVLYFDAELERASVTRESVRIRERSGRPARGSFEVSGKSLRFRPAPVFARTLDDGGFRPGCEYEVELVGFPDPAALRSATGAPLGRSERWSFRTVSLDDAADLGARRLIFQDATPERGHALGLASGTVGPRQPLYLRAGEPLDPSTLFGEDFRLRPRGGGESVGLRARLVPPPGELGGGLPRDEEAGWIELVPLAPLRPGTWRLEIEPRLRLRDYGGNPIWAPSSTEGLGFDLRVTPEPSLARGRYDESFLAPDRRSPLPPPALDGLPFDGTARWARAGVVGVRLPAAVGDGTDGEVRLAGSESRSDVRATRLWLAEGAGCELTAGPGLVVLRSQGRMQIDGRLARASGQEPASGPSFAGHTLTSWLAEAASPREGEDGSTLPSAPWTVLIAGGDLVIGGVLLVDGPLLLVAGGVVRVTGTVQAPPGMVSMLGEGGVGGLNPDRAELVLDEPVRNPLVTTLRLGVLSQSIPPRGRVARWLDSEVRGHHGAGRYRVRFLAEPSADPERPGAVHDTPRLFEDTGSLLFLAELEIGPGPPGALWDPPFVDEVSVTWEEAGR